VQELDVYIDESGNTGDIAGDEPFREQATFAVVGLVEVSGSGNAADVLAELRKKHRLQGAEVKSKSIRERPILLTDLITGLCHAGLTPFVELMDKRFYVATNIVTYVLGIDWFDPSSRVAHKLANALAEVIPTLGDDMLAAYSRFAKTPTRELCDAFLISLRSAVRAALVHPCPDRERREALVFAEVASGRAAEVAQEPDFVCERFLQDPDDSPGGHRLGLLPHVQAFANLLARLNRFSRRAGRVRLLHDEQRQFDRVLRSYFVNLTSNALSTALETSVANERAGVDWNFTHGKFELSFVDSKDHAGVQAADIIAGFCVRRLNEVINGGRPDSRFDEVARMLSSMESKAGLNFVTTDERRLAFCAGRREAPPE
jgi:hypothetical protein